MSSNLVVITGASKGIGAEIARQVAEAGYPVLLIARSVDGLNNIAEYIQAEGGIVYTLSCDITKVADIKKVVRFVDDFQGDFKVLVHNAGIARVAKITDMKPSDWREQLEVNLTAPFLVSQQLAPKLSEGGQIIFINSAAGRQSFAEWGGYSVSKYGLKALADALRQELAEDGLRVTTIFPSSVNTSIHDSLPYNWDRDKMLKAADVARAVMYCLKQPPSVRINEIDLEYPAGKF